MRNKTKKLFTNAVTILQAFGVKKEDIIVTGSVALDIYGLLPEDRDIHDFDCIVSLDNKKRGYFNLFSEVFKSEKSPSWSESKFIEIGNNLINVWVVDKSELHNENCVKYNGVAIKDIQSILKVKKEYNRNKDNKDINQIVKIILN